MVCQGGSRGRAHGKAVRCNTNYHDLAELSIKLRGGSGGSANVNATLGARGVSPPEGRLSAEVPISPLNLF